MDFDRVNTVDLMVKTICSLTYLGSALFGVQNDHLIVVLHRCFWTEFGCVLWIHNVEHFEGRAGV